MTLRSNYGSVWRRLMMSWHICMCCSFWSSFSSLCVIFVLSLRMVKSLVIIFQTLSFFMSCWLAIIRMVNRRSPHTTYIMLLEDLSLLESSFTYSHFSLNFSYHSKTNAWYGVIFIHFLKHLNCQRQNFPSPNQKFLVHSWLHIHRSFLSLYS